MPRTSPFLIVLLRPRREFFIALVLVFCCVFFKGPVLAESGKTAELDQLNEEGFTALHLAAMKGDVERIDTLVESGADLEVRQAEFSGRPLQYAASFGHLGAVQTLVKAGAKLDSRDNMGRTPLMWAAQKGHVTIAKFLVKAGADVHAATPTRWNALRYAQKQADESQSQELVKYLRKRGATLPKESFVTLKSLSKFPEGRGTIVVPVQMGDRRLQITITVKEAKSGAQSVSPRKAKKQRKRISAEHSSAQVEAGLKAEFQVEVEVVEGHQMNADDE